MSDVLVQHTSGLNSPKNEKENFIGLLYCSTNTDVRKRNVLGIHPEQTQDNVDISFITSLHVWKQNGFSTRLPFYLPWLEWHYIPFHHLAGYLWCHHLWCRSVCASRGSLTSFHSHTCDSIKKMKYINVLIKIIITTHGQIQPNMYLSAVEACCNTTNLYPTLIMTNVMSLRIYTYMPSLQPHLFVVAHIFSHKLTTGRATFVNCGHLKKILLLPDLKSW